MTDTPLTRMELKHELAQARRMHVAEEREQLQRVKAERTAKLRAMRVAKDEAGPVKLRAKT